MRLGRDAMSASAKAVRRLRRDFEAFLQSPHASIAAQPSGADALRWDFLFHNLPADTPYAGGVYHGYLLFPADYPLAPPKAYMCTPSGRLETGSSICLSATAFHPEQWNPAWTAGTLLVGILSFFLSEEAAVGTVRASDVQRKHLAARSREACREDAELLEMFPELLRTTTPGDADAAAPPRPPAGRPPGAPTTPLAALAVPLLDAEDPVATPRAAASAPAARGAECWICRDESSGEALIRPCACRGSMGGVHASCISAWLLQAAEHGQLQPTCPVCRHAYRGCRVMHPGIRVFAAELCDKLGCRGLMRRLPRFLCMLLCMRLYADLWVTEAPSPGGVALPDARPEALDAAWAVLVAACLTLFFLEHALIMAVSLPGGDLAAAFRGDVAPAPRHPRLRRFYAGSRAELFLAAWEKQPLVLWMWWLKLHGEIPTAGLLPLAVYILPLIKVLAYRSARLCARHTACYVILVVGFGGFVLIFDPFVLILCNLLLLALLFLLGVAHIHPGDAGPHIITATLVLCISSLRAWGDLVQIGIKWVGELTGLKVVEALAEILVNTSTKASAQKVHTSWNSTDCSDWEGEMDQVFPSTLRWVAAAVMMLHTGLLLALLVDCCCFERMSWRPGIPRWLAAGGAVLLAWALFNMEFLTCLVMECTVRVQTAVMATISSTWASSLWTLVVLVEFKRWRDIRSWRIIVGP